ncbi:hypothetical protein [Acinetobacter soli]|uniref:hypothetical protein n=1 Tax=Acinetobacter soli TaxID=487316 RepID=UPI001D1732F1|nr:hypothetical protein [Acinetobacter soli]
MDKLKSPLGESEFFKIQEYCKQAVIHDAEGIEKFKQLNAAFNLYLVDLTEKEKVRAWFYLRDFSKKSKVSIKKVAEIDFGKQGLTKSESFFIKMIVAIFVFIVIFSIYFFLLHESNEEKLMKKIRNEEIVKNYQGQDSVKKILKDPYSVRFQKMNGFCGELNSKNSFGAYTGFVRFIGMPNLTIIEGQSVDDDTFNEVWNKFCK